MDNQFNKLMLSIIENIIKKITHDFGNPISALINTSEVLRMQQDSSIISSKSNSSQSNLNSIFQNASQSLYKKLNFFRYFFFSEKGIISEQDDEIFIEIIHDFENRHSFHLNFDFSNSETIFKKNLLSFLSIFSYFILKDSIVKFTSTPDSKNFYFEFEIDEAHKQELSQLINFFINPINSSQIESFLNPIDIFTLYFKLFLDSNHFEFSVHQDQNLKRKIRINLTYSK
jgi:hypothetical protein